MGCEEGQCACIRRSTERLLNRSDQLRMLGVIENQIGQKNQIKSPRSRFGIETSQEIFWGASPYIAFDMEILERWQETTVVFVPSEVFD